MKILVVCQYYYPEPFRISDICEQLAADGHDVTVVTGVPNYPMGKVYDGYRGKSKRDEIIGGVKVHRCSTIARRTGNVFRVLNYISYPISSSGYVKKLGDDFDMVFVNQLSPVLMAKAGIDYAKKHNKKLVMYSLDIWPESLAVSGFKRTSLIYRYLKRVSEKIYKSADTLLITSRSFAKYFKSEFGITTAEYLPQYAESIFNPNDCKKEPNDTIDLMFAGNIGTAQSVETIIEAAKLTEDIKNLRWHIVGDGSSLADCKALADKLKLESVIFHGRKELSKMPEFYSMADAMLVTMTANPLISYTLPGKVQTYMAAQKPIIAAADGETQSVIEDAKCGFYCESGNAKALSECVRSFIASSDKDELAQNALSYYEKNFSKESFMNSLEKYINN